MNGSGTVDAGRLGNLNAIGKVRIGSRLHTALKPCWHFGLAGKSKIPWLPKKKDSGGERLAGAATAQRCSAGMAGITSCAALWDAAANSDMTHSDTSASLRS